MLVIVFLRNSLNLGAFHLSVFLMVVVAKDVLDLVRFISIEQRVLSVDCY